MWCLSQRWGLAGEGCWRGHHLLAQVVQQLFAHGVSLSAQPFQESLAPCLRTIVFPNYILATQTFANTWAALQLIQNYLAELTNEQAVEEAEELRDGFRKDGMSMAILVTNRHLPPRTIGFKLLALTPEDES